MIEYWDIDKYIVKKADLYNYINPFFNLEYLKSHNFFYILMSLSKYKSYFDNLYIDIDANIRLDINQRIAILSSPKNELIIAGAGSGKTTTVAAKIKYMVEILKIEPAEILLLSYTNEAVKEMKNIIVDKFKIQLDIMTFHKFAKTLLNYREKIESNIDYKYLDKSYDKFEKVMLLSFLYLSSSLTFKDIKDKNSSFFEIFYSFEHNCNKYFYDKNELRRTIKAFMFKKNATIYFNKLSNKKVTFDSLIYNAFKIEEYYKHYKYILIDEYQDISNLRFAFIQKYALKENAKLMCVGDDWQTIFSFASSNINNILKFAKVFNDTKVLKIVNTYRNSQELIDIAGNFVMKNNDQIKKRLKSSKRINSPIEFIEYRDKKDLINKLSFIIDELMDYKIAFVSRYNFDIKLILDNDVFKIRDNKIIYKNVKEIKFYTIHTSKGLGFDYVFILNHMNGYYGFPSKKKGDNLFKGDNQILEERRLYYVALTRTKNKVYLIYPHKKKSIFLKEMKKMLKKN